MCAVHTHPLKCQTDPWGHDVGSVVIGEFVPTDPTGKKIGVAIWVVGTSAKKGFLFPKEMEAAIVQGTHDPAVITLLNFALDIPEAKKLGHDEFLDALVRLRTAVPRIEL
jgi:hypothetical protein